MYPDLGANLSCYSSKFLWIVSAYIAAVWGSSKSSWSNYSIWFTWEFNFSLNAQSHSSGRAPVGRESYGSSWSIYTSSTGAEKKLSTWILDLGLMGSSILQSIWSSYPLAWEIGLYWTDYFEWSWYAFFFFLMDPDPLVPDPRLYLLDLSVLTALES